MSSLEDRLDTEAVGWRPVAGEKLTGVIVDISEGSSDYGTYPLVEISADDGRTVTVHAFHTVLKNELASKKPNVGDRIGIKYVGIPPGKNYETYRVVLERGATAAPTTDWDAMGAATSAELAQSGEKPQFEPF